MKIQTPALDEIVRALMEVHEVHKSTGLKELSPLKLSRSIN